jgi:hypothetical protein
MKCALALLRDALENSDARKANKSKRKRRH